MLEISLMFACIREEVEREAREKKEHTRNVFCCCLDNP
jgi:hypothetical protein